MIWLLSRPSLPFVSSTGDAQEDWEREKICWRRGVEEAGGWRSRIRRRQKRLVLYKSFDTHGPHLIFKGGCSPHIFTCKKRDQSMEKQLNNFGFTEGKTIRKSGRLTLHFFVKFFVNVSRSGLLLSVGAMEFDFQPCFISKKCMFSTLCK
jgi:hypothetical protein